MSILEEAIAGYLSRGGDAVALFDFVYREALPAMFERSHPSNVYSLRLRTLPELSPGSLKSMWPKVVCRASMFPDLFDKPKARALAEWLLQDVGALTQEIIAWTTR